MADRTDEIVIFKGKPHLKCNRCHKFKTVAVFKNLQGHGLNKLCSACIDRVKGTRTESVRRYRRTVKYQNYAEKRSIDLGVLKKLKEKHPKTYKRLYREVENERLSERRN